VPAAGGGRRLRRLSAEALQAGTDGVGGESGLHELVGSVGEGLPNGLREWHLMVVVEAAGVDPGCHPLRGR